MTDMYELSDVANEFGVDLSAGDSLDANDEALSTDQVLKFLRDDVVALQRDVTELLTLLRPLGPALEKLPEMVEQVGPLIEAAKKSPVLRMLGISL